MSSPPKIPDNQVYSAEDVRAISNIAYQQGTPMTFIEMDDLIGFFDKLSSGMNKSRPFDESFSLVILNNVPAPCLNYAAPLPLISLFQQCFYSGVYDTGVSKADKGSHALALECQRLLGELLLNEEESKISVLDLTHRLLNRLSPKNTEWIGAMSNFFAACKGLLKRENLSILRKETAEEVEVAKPFSLPQVFVFVANKAKLNLLTLQLAHRQLLDCFDQWNCSLQDCLVIFQKDLEVYLQNCCHISNELQQTIKQAHFSWCAKLQSAFSKLVRGMTQPLTREWMELFDQACDIINTLDAEEGACALFVKNNWKTFENLGKKFVKLELEELTDLANVLESLTLVRYLDYYLKGNQNLDQKLNAEQLRFDLLQAYSKQSGYPNSNTCWKRSVSLQFNVKGRTNAREFLKASMCTSQLHKLLSEMRPIVKAVTTVTYQEVQSLFAKRERLVREIQKALGIDKVIEELLSSSMPKPLASFASTSEEVVAVVSQEEVEEEKPLPEAVSRKEKGYPDALLLISEDLQRSLKSIFLMVPATKRQFLQNAEMKLSLLIAELLSASQGLQDKHRRCHAMTVAKYIHGMLQEILTAILEDPVTERVHSLTALAKLAKVDAYAELFIRYDNAGAAARRPQQYDAFPEKQEVLSALIVLDGLLDHFALAQSPLQKRFAELFEIISHFEPARISHKNFTIDGQDVASDLFTMPREHCQIDFGEGIGNKARATDCPAFPKVGENSGPTPTPILEKPSPVGKMIDLFKQKALALHPAAKQCLEHTVWNLEMLDYRLARTHAASFASIDLLANECFDLFHTVSELILRARMIQEQLYRTEKETHQELGHSLEAQVRKAGFPLDLWEEDVKEFIKEYDQISFTRFSGRSVATSAASIAQKARKTATLQRRLLGQKGYAELTQVWSELEWEMSYNSQLIPETGFTVSASSSTKKALQIYQTTLEKVNRDVNVLLKFLTLIEQGL